MGGDGGPVQARRLETRLWRRCRGQRGARVDKRGQEATQRVLVLRTLGCRLVVGGCAGRVPHWPGTRHGARLWQCCVLRVPHQSGAPGCGVSPSLLAAPIRPVQVGFPLKPPLPSQ